MIDIGHKVYTYFSVWVQSIVILVVYWQHMLDGVIPFSAVPFTAWNSIGISSLDSGFMGQRGHETPKQYIGRNKRVICVEAIDILRHLGEAMFRNIDLYCSIID